MARASRQLELRIRSWGGRRRGAGRKPASGVVARRRIAAGRRTIHAVRCM